MPEISDLCHLGKTRMTAYGKSGGGAKKDDFIETGQLNWFPSQNSQYSPACSIQTPSIWVWKQNNFETMQL